MMIIATAPAAAEVSFDDILARPRPKVDRTIRYGTEPDQFGELYLPKTAGPHPVAVLIHGGCWSAQLPGLELMAQVAADLRGRGFAVWNIEYRRLGARGGGYPDMFLDVGTAIDKLRGLAPEFKLDLHHVVLIGHSAGGHLALWAAARSRIPKSAPLGSSNPLPVSAVVTLSGIGDLRAFRDNGPGVCGEPAAVDRLVGASARKGIDPYSDTSPAALLPLGVKQIVVTGAHDEIVPTEFGRNYAARARSSGDTVQLVQITNAGHFEMIDPRSAAWAQIVPLIQTAMR